MTPDQQPITCICGRPRAEHEFEDDGAMGWHENGCQGYQPRAPITWLDIARELAAIVLQAAACLDGSVGELEVARTADEGIMRAHATRGRGLRLAGIRIDALLTHVRESAPSVAPARPLEAVLADIVAAGHGNVEVYRRASSPRWIAKSDNGSVRFPGTEAGRERIDAYYVAIEYGEVEIDGGGSANAVAAAEARLADIRKLHAAAVAAVQRDADADAEAMLEQGEAIVHYGASGGDCPCGAWVPQYRVSTDPEKVTCPACVEAISQPPPDDPIADPGDEPGPEEVDSEHAATEPLRAAGVTEITVVAQVNIEDGQAGRYAVGRVDFEDDEPWWVVDRETMCSVFTFDNEQDACGCRDALNAEDTDRVVEVQRAQIARRVAREESEES